MEKDKNKRYQELSDFLKSRRHKVKPEQAGLPVGSRRRTPGLRREEAAQLAGMGLTWYTWLEQGREINVSDQVLDSLSRVFQLTKEERLHLYTLAHKSNSNGEIAEEYQSLKEPLIRLLERLDLICCPAYLMDQRWNILAWNKASDAVFGDFARLPVEERNVVRMMFCNKAYMQLFDDWPYHAKGVIARFHAAVARHIDDPWFGLFIERMKVESEDFGAWWVLYDLQGMSDVVKELTHPTAGKLTLTFVSFDVSDNQNLKALIHNPDENSLLKIRDLMKKGSQC